MARPTASTPSRREPRAANRPTAPVAERPTTIALMLALTFSTGSVDCVGYLALDRVFTGNMTGNVVILGMAILGTPGFSVAGPLVALFGFGVGATAAGAVLRTNGPRWSSRTTALLVVAAACFAAVATQLHSTSAPGRRLVLTGVLALALGLQAAAARTLAVRELSTVVVTSTLTGLGFDALARSASGPTQRRRVLAIAVLLAGAVSGTALLQWHAAAAVLLSSLVTLAVTCYGHATLREG